VFPGGVVILAGTLDALGIGKMRMPRARCAMGLVYDMGGAGLKRIEDPRERPVGSMQRRLPRGQRPGRTREPQRLKFFRRSGPRPGGAGKMTTPKLSPEVGGAAHEDRLDVGHSGLSRQRAYLLEECRSARFAA